MKFGEWWIDFFGWFYDLADDSDEGFDVSKGMNREQRTDREIEIILKYLSLTPKAKILDCPCGGGRHSVELAKKGFDVVGIDLNDYMLSRANENMKLANVVSNLSFSKMDMRNLEFKNASFDSIINMYLSFGFFDDENNEKVVKEFYRLLKQGGKLLVHLDLNYDRVINKSYFKTDQNLSRNCKSRILEQRESYDEKSKRLLGEWKLINSKTVIKNYSLRIYDNDTEFIPLFKNNGFSSVTLFDPDNDQHTIDSKETILVAIK